MKDIIQGTSLKRAVCLICALLLPSIGQANTTNTVPFSQSFEGLPDGQSIIESNGWYAGSNTYAIATNATYTYGQMHPIAGPHNTHIILDTESGAISNKIYPVSTNGTWLDLMLQPTRWNDELPPSTNDASSKFMFFVNSNGNPVVYHSIPSDWNNLATSTNAFTVFDGTFIDSNDWIRLSVSIDFDGDYFNGGVFCKVAVNGTELIAPDGVQSPDQPFTQYDGTPGPWLLIPNFAGNSGDYSEIVISGTGFMDDFVVGGTPVFSIMWAITASVNNALGASTTPAGTFMVDQGATTSIVINVSNFWDIADVTTNGVSVGTPGTVTIANVSCDYTVSVTVAAQLAVNDTPKWWLASYTGGDGADTNATADTDGDGLLNWQEWLASTDPDDPGNKFEIIDHYVTDGTGYVVWVSQAIDPGLPPFAVLRSTNLSDSGGGWVVVDDSVSRGSGPNGTNIWQDTAPIGGGTAVYYRVSATN